VVGSKRDFRFRRWKDIHAGTKKTDAPDRCQNLKRKILKTTDLIKDFGSRPKIVKFLVVQKREESQAEKRT
jgi:hypothetical protein